MENKPVYAELPARTMQQETAMVHVPSRLPDKPRPQRVIVSALVRAAPVAIGFATEMARRWLVNMESEPRAAGVRQGQGRLRRHRRRQQSSGDAGGSNRQEHNIHLS